MDGPCLQLSQSTFIRCQEFVRRITKVGRYRKYAGAKFRPLDEAYISSFNALVAGQILKGKEMAYHALPVQNMLPTPPPSEKSVDGDEQELESQGSDCYGVGQILAI